MIPTTFSARTLDQLLRFLDEHGRLGALCVLPLFTMAAHRKRLHLDIIERLAEDYPDLLATHIPDASDVERMGIHRQPLPAYAIRSIGILPASAGTDRREGKAVSPDRCLSDACRLEGGAPPARAFATP